MSLKTGTTSPRQKYSLQIVLLITRPSPSPHRTGRCLPRAAARRPCRPRAPWSQSWASRRRARGQSGRGRRISPCNVGGVKLYNRFRYKKEGNNPKPIGLYDQ